MSGFNEQPVEGPRGHRRPLRNSQPRRYSRRMGLGLKRPPSYKTSETVSWGRVALCSPMPSSLLGHAGGSTRGCGRACRFLLLRCHSGGCVVPVGASRQRVQSTITLAMARGIQWTPQAEEQGQTDDQSESLSPISFGRPHTGRRETAPSQPVCRASTVRWLTARRAGTRPPHAAAVVAHQAASDHIQARKSPRAGAARASRAACPRPTLSSRPVCIVPGFTDEAAWTDTDARDEHLKRPGGGCPSATAIVPRPDRAKRLSLGR